jgi:hypothetical protein
MNSHLTEGTTVICSLDEQTFVVDGLLTCVVDILQHACAPCTSPNSFLISTSAVLAWDITCPCGTLRLPFVLPYTVFRATCLITHCYAAFAAFLCCLRCLFSTTQRGERRGKLCLPIWNACSATGAHAPGDGWDLHSSGSSAHGLVLPCAPLRTLPLLRSRWSKRKRPRCTRSVPTHALLLPLLFHDGLVPAVLN